MTDLHFATDIMGATCEEVFSLLANLREYDHWLPRSTSYEGTTEISDGPIRLGTKYFEPSKFGVRVGEITEFLPPNKLSFHQPMTSAKWLGFIDIRIDYTITSAGNTVHVDRILRLTPHGLISLGMPFTVPIFRAENLRMMSALKLFVESRHNPPS